MRLRVSERALEELTRERGTGKGAGQRRGSGIKGGLEHQLVAFPYKWVFMGQSIA
jgi:hypothetical protein